MHIFTVAFTRAQARRVLDEKGILILSWTSDVRKGKVVKGWQDRTDTQQIEMVKKMLTSVGMHETTLRVDISGPTSGPKLYVISGSPTQKTLSEKVGRLFFRLPLFLS